VEKKLKKKKILSICMKRNNDSMNLIFVINDKSSRYNQHNINNKNRKILIII